MWVNDIASPCQNDSVCLKVWYVHQAIRIRPVSVRKGLLDFKECLWESYYRDDPKDWDK